MAADQFCRRRAVPDSFRKKMLVAGKKNIHDSTFLPEEGWETAGPVPPGERREKKD